MLEDLVLDIVNLFVNLETTNNWFVLTFLDLFIAVMLFAAVALTVALPWLIIWSLVHGRFESRKDMFKE